MEPGDRTLDDSAAARRALDFQGRFGAAPATRDTTDQEPLTPGAPPDLGVPVEPDLDGGAGRYAVSGLLGRGGGGEVWGVADRRLGRMVAIKVQHASASGDSRRSARFAVEARTTASLEHPSILPIFDLGRAADGRLWFSMRCAAGTSLADAIEAIVRDQAPEAVRTVADQVQVLVRVCEAVAYAHDHGVVHRDLKPGNIMIGSYGELLVVDWGSAVAIGAVQGGVAGTPLYMSPEQARGEPAGTASDIYSLGATAWQLLTLHPVIDPEAEQGDFWERKRRGEADPAPAACPVDPGLLALVRKALAAEPEDRWPSAAAFGQALRGWLRGREGAAIRERAEDRLAELLHDGDHAGFVRVVEDLRHAADLGDARAGAAVAAARRAHAGFAIARGDLHLATGLVEAGSPEAAALATALAHRRRLRVLAWCAGAAAAVLLCATILWWWRDRQAREGAWQVVVDRDLRGASSAGLVWPQKGEQDRLQPGPAGVALPTNRLLWVEGVMERGDVRVTVDATWNAGVDGLELWANSADELPQQPFAAPPGIACQFGGYTGSRSFCFIVPMPGVNRTGRSAFPEFVSNRAYRLTLERRGERIRLLVDGREIISHEQLLPPCGDGLGRVGVRAWSPVTLHRVVVERLGVAARPGPFGAGDAFRAVGDMPRARTAYLRVAEDHPDTELSEEALAQATLAACNDRGVAAAERAAFRDRLAARHPGSRFLRPCGEALALAAWQDPEGHARGLDLAEAVLAEWPDSTIVQDLLNLRPTSLAAPIVQRLLDLVCRSPAVEDLNLAFLGLDSVERLRSLRPWRIVLTGNRITDLSPLRGMPLRELNCVGNHIADLSPLAGMPLVYLVCGGNRITDLSPLRGMRLTYCDVVGNPIEDAAALAGMPLQSLNLAQTGIRRLPDIDWSVLDVLTASYTPLSDLAPLAQAVRLQRLIITRTAVTDLAPLANCRRLEHLNLQTTRVRDLSAVRGLPLRELDIADCAVEDLSPLAGMPLRHLRAARAPLRDLRPLTGLPLESATITPPSAGLEGLPLERIRTLDLVLTGPTDLARLRGSAVRSLRLSGGTAVDLSPLTGLSDQTTIQVLGTDRPAGPWADLAQALRGLGRHALARRVDTLAAFLEGDRERLRSYAVRQDGRLRVFTGIRCQPQEARTLAARFGARLPCLIDEVDERALITVLGSADGCHLGLVRRPEGGVAWADGRPVVWNRFPQNVLRRVDEVQEWFLFRGEFTLVWSPVPVAANVFFSNLVLEWDDDG